MSECLPEQQDGFNEDGELGYMTSQVTIILLYVQNYGKVAVNDSNQMVLYYWWSATDQMQLQEISENVNGKNSIPSISISPLLWAHRLFA